MIIRKISHILCNYENITRLFAGACLLLFIAGILLLPLPYSENELYPKNFDRNSSLDPYDRGGPPFTQVTIVSQYPENSPTAGLVTSYLTPFSLFLSQVTCTSAPPSSPTREELSMRSCTTPGGWIPLSRPRSSSSRLPLPRTSTGGLTMWAQYSYGIFVVMVAGVIAFYALARERDDLHKLLLLDLVEIVGLGVIALLGTDLAEALILPGLTVGIAELLALSQIYCTKRGFGSGRYGGSTSK